MGIKGSYTKSVIICGMKLLHFVVCFVAFSFFWQFFYSINSVHNVLLRYDALMCCFFGVCTVVFNCIYQSYVVGFGRIANLVYLQILSNLLSYGLIYVFHCIVWFKLFDPLMLLSALALQVIFNFVWCFSVKALNFLLHAKKKTIILYRNANDLEKLQEVKLFTDRFKVAKSIEISGDDYKEIGSLIEGHEAFFVAGFNATVIFSPIMLFVALAVKLYDGGSVFYKQVRLTEDG